MQALSVRAESAVIESFVHRWFGQNWMNSGATVVSILLTITFRHPYMRGTPLGAREAGACPCSPGDRIAPLSLTQTGSLARRGYGMRPIMVASAITARQTMKRDLYAEVSARIVAELERGAAPWIKPWSATPGANTPCDAVSNRPYSGCNVVLLWMAQAAGYRTPRFFDI